MSLGLNNGETKKGTYNQLTNVKLLIILLLKV
jgi:hypothetical protein